jgi:hypothetical protein
VKDGKRGDMVTGDADRCVSWIQWTAMATDARTGVGEPVREGGRGGSGAPPVQTRWNGRDGCLELDERTGLMA